MVGFYNDRLTERERRRDFLRARDLLNMRRMQASITARRQPCDGCRCQSVCDLAFPDELQDMTSGLNVLWMLMHWCCWQGVERRRTTRDRDFHAQLRPLARYQPQPQHEIMAEGLLLEARLRARLLVRSILSTSTCKGVPEGTSCTTCLLM